MQMNLPNTSQLLYSLKKNRTGILMMLVSSTLVAFGQLMWKLSGGTDLFMIFAGMGLYGFASILMIIAFRFGSFSVLHPMFALNYVLGLTIGSLLFHEIISPLQVFGVLIIIAGVCLIGVGDA